MHIKLVSLDEITLVCLGPLTNIALTLKAFPSFADNIKDVFVMGGNYTAMGNSTKRPEFNIHLDPEAADIVFRSLGDKCTLLPLETCRATKITLEWRQQLEQSCGNTMKFLHTIEAPLLLKKIEMGFDNFVSSDALLAVIVSKYDQAVKNHISHYIGVELEGKYTRGQLVVLDHLNDNPRLKTKIVLTVCAQTYMDIIQSVKDL